MENYGSLFKGNSGDPLGEVLRGRGGDLEKKKMFLDADLVINKHCHTWTDGWTEKASEDKVSAAVALPTSEEVCNGHANKSFERVLYCPDCSDSEQFVRDQAVWFYLVAGRPQCDCGAAHAAPFARAVCIFGTLWHKGKDPSCCVAAPASRCVCSFLAGHLPPLVSLPVARVSLLLRAFVCPAPLPAPHCLPHPVTEPSANK